MKPISLADCRQSKSLNLNENPVKLLIPEILQDRLLRGDIALPEHLKPKDVPRLYYILSILITKRYTDDVHPSHFVPLKSEYLIPVIGKGKNVYEAVMQCLIDQKIIERSNYKVGVKSYGYRLGPEYRKSNVIEVPVTGPRNYADRIHRSRIRASESGLEVIGRDVADLLFRNTQLLSVNDMVEALQYIEESSDPVGVMMQKQYLDAIEEGRILFFTVVPVGRVFSHFTNLSKECRHVLRLIGHSILGLDVSCCQPTILGSIHPNPNSREAKVFLDLTTSGQFYEHLMESPLLQGLSRDLVKEGFAALIHGHPSQLRDWKAATAVEEVMRGEFPVLHDWVMRQKGATIATGEYKRLGSRIMNLEARAVIGGTMSRLLRIDPNFVALTLHDGIETIPENVETVERALLESFREVTGVTALVKVKQCKNGPPVQVPDHPISVRSLAPASGAGNPKSLTDGDGGATQAVVWKLPDHQLLVRMTNVERQEDPIPPDRLIARLSLETSIRLAGYDWDKTILVSLLAPPNVKDLRLIGEAGIRCLEAAGQLRPDSSWFGHHAISRKVDSPLGDTSAFTILLGGTDLPEENPKLFMRRLQEQFEDAWTKEFLCLAFCDSAKWLEMRIVGVKDRVETIHAFTSRGSFSGYSNKPEASWEAYGKAVIPRATSAIVPRFQAQTMRQAVSEVIRRNGGPNAGRRAHAIRKEDEVTFLIDKGEFIRIYRESKIDRCYA